MVHPHASITAGVALLLMSVIAIFGSVVVVGGLVTPGDAGPTASDIDASQGLFRLGIVSLILVVVLDVVVAWALYRVFSPVNASLSLLAAALRLIYSGVFMVAIGQLVGVSRLLSDDNTRAALGADHVDAQAMLGIVAFHDIWYVAQALFGAHLLLIGFLAYRSGYIPRLWAPCSPSPARATPSTASVPCCPEPLDQRQLLHLPRRVPPGALAHHPSPPDRRHRPGVLSGPRVAVLGCLVGCLGSDGV